MMPFTPFRPRQENIPQFQMVTRPRPRPNNDASNNTSSQRSVGQKPYSNASSILDITNRPPQKKGKASEQPSPVKKETLENAPVTNQSVAQPSAEGTAPNLVSGRGPRNTSRDMPRDRSRVFSASTLMAGALKGQGEGFLDRTEFIVPRISGRSVEQLSTLLEEPDRKGVEKMQDADPLPMIWEEQHDRVICTLEVRGKTHAQMVYYLRERFPELKQHKLSPDTVKKRLCVLDLNPNITYFGDALRQLDPQFKDYVPTMLQEIPNEKSRQDSAAGNSQISEDIPIVLGEMHDNAKSAFVQHELPTTNTGERVSLGDMLNESRVQDCDSLIMPGSYPASITSSVRRVTEPWENGFKTRFLAE